ncbi:MAG: hypothetical protein Q8M24_14765 [Pseudolabrys sp.]|nr:hypothetical protein [Pseudolabrys sp.]
MLAVYSPNAWSGFVGRVKIPYYLVEKGRGYWRPHPRMHVFGFSCVPCGEDGPDAWAKAAQWNARWQAFRRGERQAPIDVSKLRRDEAEAVRRYPPNSVGAGFQRYIRTDEWRKKANSTRTKVWWPCWFRIRDMWGDVAPDSITFEQMSEWRAALEKLHGLDVAHKTLKIWRALWKVLLAMKIAHGDDPSMAVTNSAPAPRHQRWSEGETVRLVKGAWRIGYRGLACCIAVAWDTSFSPVDVRTLAERHRKDAKAGLTFDRQAEGRAKTGRAAIGTVSRRTERLVVAYLKMMGTELLPDAQLFRTRSGDPYREDTLADDFASVRALLFPGDKRRLMDMRRSGTVEAIAGGATGVGLAAKMANSIDRSNTLHKTYAPVSIEVVRDVDDARRRGRRKMRENE